MQVGTFYISTQGAKLTLVGERLVVREKDGKIIFDVPLFRVRQIVCFGSVEITSRVIFQVMRREIDVVYLTQTGRFKCRLSNMNGKMVKVRLKQYERATDDKFKVEMARAIVRSKLLTYRNWIRLRNRRGVIEGTEELIGLNEVLELLEKSDVVDELMGFEGIGTRLYFEAFEKAFKQDLGFYGRNRRPPRDPVNAMLSFGYTILLNKVIGALEQAGLDVFFANLHANQNGRPSLALDLMEEYRHFLVDTTVLRMANLAQVRPSDFMHSFELGVRMKPHVIALLVKELQNKLGASFYYPPDGKKVQLQDQILKQAYRYRAAVSDGVGIYSPLVFG